MKLLSLTMNNFKCFRRFELPAGGHNVEVFGTNAAGKTSLADAFYWLLTGKDSAGGAPDKLFPIGMPDGVEVSVYAEFDDESAKFTLGRVLKKKIQRINGEAEAKVRGTTTDYYINGVPKPLREYSVFVSEKFGDERTIRMLTDHSYFAGTMPWADRRDLLIHTFAPHLSDADVVRSHPEELKPLEGFIGAMRTVKDLTDEQNARRKKLKKELEEIPSRIDELMRTRPEFPTEGVTSEISALAARRLKLIVARDKLKSGGSIADAEAKISEIQAELAKAEAAYLERTRGGNEMLERQCATLRDAIQKSLANQAKCEGIIQSAQASLSVEEEELADLRKQAKAIHDRVYPADAEVCPTCGQPLPRDKIEVKRAAFNQKKAQDIEDNRNHGKQCAQACKDLKEIIAQRTQEAETEKSRQAEMQRQLDALQADIVSPPPFTETAEYDIWQKKLEAARQSARQLRDELKPRLEKCSAELADIDAQIEKIKTRDLLKQQAAQMDARMLELQEEEKRLGLELAKTENLLAAAERFVQLQADEIEERVNSAFSMVRWQMFERQVNGGIAPCCKAMVNGISYETSTNALNTAAKFNAGLDIIQTLSRELGRTLPVWIDNAESVVDYLPIESQVIRMSVSEADKDLRVEVGQ